MKLKSFGCSFIYGTDLSDIFTSQTKKIQASQLAWPALLAQKLQLSYKSYAYPGCGNLRILEHVLEQAFNPEPSIFVISWTWIDRFDYLDPESKIIWPSTGWKTIRPTDEDHTSKVYYKDMHSEYKDKLTSLIYVKTAIDTLRQNKKKFIMTNIDDLLWDDRWHSTASITALQKFARPFFTNFNGMSFLDWSKSMDFKISDSWHPLEEAHSAASDLVYKNLDNWIKK